MHNYCSIMFDKNILSVGDNLLSRKCSFSQQLIVPTCLCKNILLSFVKFPNGRLLSTRRPRELVISALPDSPPSSTKIRLLEGNGACKYAMVLQICLQYHFRCYCLLTMIRHQGSVSVSLITDSS